MDKLINVIRDAYGLVRRRRKGIIMIKIRKIMTVMFLLLAFLPANSNAGYTWTGNGHYQIGGEFGYPTTSFVNTFDTVTVTMVDAGGVDNAFNMYDSSHLTMYGGTIGELNLYQNATASLFSTGHISSLWVDAASTGWVKLYAHSVIFFPSSGGINDSSVGGWWNSNNQWFEIYFKGDRTQGEITRSFIQIVPEPASSAIFALGSLLIYSRRKRKPTA
jgi:hypothetical protein